MLYHLLNYSSNIKTAVNDQSIHLGFIVVLEHLFSPPENVLIKTYWKQVLIQVVISENTHRPRFVLLYSSADTSKSYLRVLTAGNSKHKSPAGVEVSAPLKIKGNTTGYRQRICVLSLSLSMKLVWRKSVAVQQNPVFLLCIVFLLYPCTLPLY